MGCIANFLDNLVGGLEYLDFFPIILGMSSSQLTFIFFRRVETTNSHSHSKKGGHDHHSLEYGAYVQRNPIR